MTEKNIKAAKRVLKELGIYNLYIKYRTDSRKYCRLHNTGNSIFYDLPNLFHGMIDKSFTWCDTDCEDLWDILYTLGLHNQAGESYFTFEYILKNKILFEEIKAKTKHYIDEKFNNF